MAGLSNGKFLPLLPAPPAPGTGWSVAVIAHTDFYWYAKNDPAHPVKPIATIYRYQNLQWSPELSNVGAGSLTLLASDPLLHNPLSDGREGTAVHTYDNLFVIYQDGQWRGEFIGMKVEKVTVTVDGMAAEAVKISGPGGAQTLAWACVMSPYFPKQTPKDKNGFYSYKNLPVMASWLDLLWIAQRRGSIPWVHVKFNATRDSAGELWDDTVPAKTSNLGDTVLGDVNFTTDSSALTAAGTKAVKAMVKKIADISYPYVSLVGHADSRGTVAHNYQIGLDRANTVRNAILAIRALKNIQVTSMGEKQPLQSNDSPAGQAKNRRVHATYTTSAPIPDTLYQPDAGTTMLDLLKALTSGQTTAGLRGPIACEWLMKKGFQLHVRRRIEGDRSDRAVFHEGSDWLVSSTTTFDRTQLATLVAVRNDYDVWKVAQSAAGTARWHQREQYIRLEGTTYNEKIQAQVAQMSLEAVKDPIVQTVVKIQPGYGRVPFRDFSLGDWIGVVVRHGAKPSTVDKQRVIAISVEVNADGVASYEIQLSSTKQTRVSWLKMQLDALINKKQGIRAMISDDQPRGGVPGDLWTPETKISI